MFRDSEDAKWEYAQHTEAKHAVLAAYLKAWLPILARGARQAGRRAELVIVDGFAGRGHYVRGERGSPLILRRIAGEAAAYAPADEVEIFFVERDPNNFEELVKSLSAEPTPARVVEHPPANTDFARAARRILQRLDERPRPSFWFIDPFGFSGIPLELIRDILARPRAEVFITFMVRDVNRFIEQPDRQQAVAELLGLAGTELQAAVNAIVTAPRRALALRDLYVDRLRRAAGANFVWPFRVAATRSRDTVYYLMHGPTHVKAFREMKDATFEISRGHHAFLGRDDFSVTGQEELPFLEMEIPNLKQQLLRVFAGRELEYDPLGERGLLNEAYPDPRFHYFVKQHFREALRELISEQTVSKTPVDTKGGRGLQGRDKLRFPAAK